MPSSADWITSSGAAEINVERELVSVEVRQQFQQQRNIGFQPDAFAHLDEVLAAHAAEFRIVQQKVRELAALLYQVDVRQSGDTLAETRNTQKVAQNVPRIVKAERLIEVAE